MKTIVMSESATGAAVRRDGRVKPCGVGKRKGRGGFSCFAFRVPRWRSSSQPSSADRSGPTRRRRSRGDRRGPETVATRAASPHRPALKLQPPSRRRPARRRSQFRGRAARFEAKKPTPGSRRTFFPRLASPRRPASVGGSSGVVLCFEMARADSRTPCDARTATADRRPRRLLSRAVDSTRLAGSLRDTSPAARGTYGSSQ